MAQLTKISKEEVLQKLRELKPYLQREFGIKEIGIFGSVVRNEQKPDSDIDILIDYDISNLENLDFLGLKVFLEDIFGRKVDLVSKKTLKGKVEILILKEVIYA